MNGLPVDISFGCVLHKKKEQSSTEDRWRVSVETDFLTSVPVDDSKFVNDIAAHSSLLTSTYSMQYLPADVWKEHPNVRQPKLSLFSSVYVSPELVTWLPRFFAQAALVQIINAETLSDPMSKLVGGAPDFATSARNQNPDEILAVLKEIYIPEGKKPSLWRHTDEFIKFAETYGRSDFCFGNVEKSGMTLETPFGDNSALIQLHSDVEHPQLGNGLLVTIQIPYEATIEEIARESAFLNFLEAKVWTEFPQLGSWQPHAVDGGKSFASHMLPLYPTSCMQAGLRRTTHSGRCLG